MFLYNLNIKVQINRMDKYFNRILDRLETAIDELEIEARYNG